MSRASKDPVRTCSISFGEAEFDEARWAAVVAERCHTNHRVERVEADDFDLIDRLATLYDEPFADSSAIPTYRVCELARRDVVVALSGDGGDEMLGGYRRYRRHLSEESLRGRVPRPARRLLGLLGGVYPRLRWAPRGLRARSVLQLLGRDGVEGWSGVTALVQEDLRHRMYAPEFRLGLQGYRGIDVLRRHAAAAPTDDPLGLVQYLDMKTYLAGDILTKVDRASMAFGLEVRVPFLDHTLVEWMTGLPNTMKIRDGEGKWILKKSLEPHLPKEILYRRKQGFAVPLATWFRGPLRARVRDTLNGPRLGDSGVFDQGFLLRLAEEHDRERQDHSAAIWAVLMFDAFLRKTMDQDGRSSAPPPLATSRR
jgi:asparagine synthase (glutamine-hydrolysing)